MFSELLKPFGTELGVVVPHPEPVCVTRESSDCCLQGQGHSEGWNHRHLINSVVGTLGKITARYLVNRKELFAAKLGKCSCIAMHEPGVFCAKCLACCLQGQGDGVGSKPQ